MTPRRDLFFPWAMALAAALPTAALAGGPDCPPWPAGVSVRLVAGRPLAFTGDFNQDGLPDRLEFIAMAADAKLPPDIPIADPWEKRPAPLDPAGTPTALAISHGSAEGVCQRIVLAPSDFFRTPLWTSYLAGEPGPAPLTIIKAKSRKHREWQRSLRALTGDAVELGTEAGIDILLYRKKSGYVLFWPAEEP